MVFHFFAGNDFETNTANLIHFRCMNYFQDVFDEININIAVDDINDINLQISAKNKFAQVFDRCKNLRLKVVQNTGYYESDTYYNEVLLNTKNLNGLTFFGHNKGTTNFANPSYDKFSIANWICGLYYFSLNFPNEVERMMLADGYPFYGSFLLKNDIIPSRHHVEYAAAYFWTNCPIIYRNICIGGMEILNLDARGFTEEFPGNFYDTDKLGSHERWVLLNGDFYYDSKSITDLCANDKKDEYYEYVSKMMEGIKYE